MKVKYIKPDVLTYSHHAFPLGIILTIDPSKNWFYSNYIYIYFYEGLNSVNFLANYDSNPFLDMRNIYKCELDEITELMGLKKWISYQIDNGFAIELLVDYFYLPHAWQFHKDHIMHEILVVGYSNEGVFYWDYIKGEYKEDFTLWEDIHIFDSKLFYGDGVAAKLYNPKHNGTFFLNEEDIIQNIYCYYKSYNPCNMLSVWGDYSDYTERIFGLNAVRELANQIKTNDTFIDFRFFNIIYEHKKMMTMRADYLYNLQYHDAWNYLCKEFKTLEESWRSLTILSLKFYLRTDNKLKIKETIINSMISLIEKENMILHTFFHF